MKTYDVINKMTVKECSIGDIFTGRGMGRGKVFADAIVTDKHEDKDGFVMLEIHHVNQDGVTGKFYYYVVISAITGECRVHDRDWHTDKLIK